MKKNDPIRKQIDADKAADKRLADAAPEMLEALNRCIKELQNWNAGNGSTIDGTDAIVMAMKATNKAEGK